MDLNYTTKQLSNVMCASLYGFDSGLNQSLTKNDLEDFLNNNQNIWLMGKKYSKINELKEFREDFISKIWITYRKNFASIGGNGPTSDQGWGCMLRCGQMVLAQAFILNSLGRDWKWIGCEKFLNEENKIKLEENEFSESVFKNIIKIKEKEYLEHVKLNQDHEIYIKILKQFQDKKTSPYSIHQIALMGACEEKPIGTWFGPNTIAQTLKKLSSFDHSNNFAIHIALDNVVIIEEIYSKCLSSQFKEEEKKKWKPLLLFIPLRLGLSEINSIYFQSIKQTFKCKQSIGIIGGKPNHALYFIGYVNNELIYLDPHKTQNTIDLDQLAPFDSFCDDSSYHCKVINRMDFNQIDPSIALCFFFKTKIDFDNWCKEFKEIYSLNEKQSLFELNETKLKQWVKTEVEEIIEYKDYDLAYQEIMLQANEATENNLFDEDEFELLG